MTNYSFEADSELLRTVDGYLRAAGHEKERYKVVEILQRCTYRVCLCDIVELEKLLEFNIREYILRNSKYYLGDNNFVVNSISDVNKYIHKSTPMSKNLSRGSKKHKINFLDLRLVLINSI